MVNFRFRFVIIGASLCAGVLFPGLSLARDLSSDGFVLPSGKIACAFAENTWLRCDVLTNGLKPKPKSATCELDWTGITLNRTGKATPTCAGDTIFGDFPTLSYGSSWRRAGMKCTATTSGLTCRNASGNGFFLSRERWKIN